MLRPITLPGRLHGSQKGRQKTASATCRPEQYQRRIAIYSTSTWRDCAPVRAPPVFSLKVRPACSFRAGTLDPCSSPFYHSTYAEGRAPKIAELRRLRSTVSAEARPLHWASLRRRWRRRCAGGDHGLDLWAKRTAALMAGCPEWCFDGSR